MLAKFLLAENPIEDGGAKEYLLHTDTPRFLAEIIETDLGYELEIIQNYDEADKSSIESIKLEMLDWWHEYLDWEDELADELE